MVFNPDVHHRRSIRLRDYDYSFAGAYFVTICAHERECLFGDLVDGTVLLNDAGLIIQEEWLRSGEVRENVVLDKFIVMPNHFHGILFITEVGATRWVALGGDRQTGNRMKEDRATQRVAPTPGPRSGSIGAMIGQFKSVATKRINTLRDNPGAPVWQRNYYERVIRDDHELDGIRRYITDNPAKWAEDENHPGRQSSE